jgi:hypothetical protein
MRSGQALTPEQQRQEEKRLDRLIRNPGELKKQKQEHERDAQKEQQLLKMLPDGFLYQYVGHEGRTIRLGFRPNPKFHPPNAEAKVFHAMHGIMLVDATENRLVELRGQLTRDVVFGWGILGRLYAGGTVMCSKLKWRPGTGRRLLSTFKSGAKPSSSRPSTSSNTRSVATFGRRRRT